MPRQLIIDDKLRLRGDSQTRLNIEGALGEIKRHYSDRFDGIALDTTNRWATSLPGTADTIAISEVQGGEVLITTGTADDDSCMLSSAIIFSADKAAIFEVKLLITDVSGTAVFAGFTDAKTESNNSIAIHYASDALTTVASNAAGFVIDADHATSSIMCEGVKANTDATSVDTGVDWADGEAHILRCVLDVDGNATFYLDNGLVGAVTGFVADAVTDSTLLCFSVQAMTRANDGANTVRVQRYDAWQDE